jgi:lipopolysaccharide/colanic/teichoic acid biosynthesis glycosyltransferase
MLFAIAATRITTGESGIFTQPRSGLHGQLFNIYKIRTMRDAYDVHGALLPDGQRLTATGAFLRRCGFDELPQLWNIVKGDMSIWGPRPQPLEVMDSSMPGFAERHSVRPGLIGLAQVCEKEAGERQTFASREERIKVDLDYIATRNLAMDLKIVFRAAALVFAGRVDSQSERPQFHAQPSSEQQNKLG